MPMGEPGACESILASIASVEKLGKRCVAHCTHGMGRSGRVAAAWLCRRYELKAAEATHEAMALCALEIPRNSKSGSKGFGMCAIRIHSRL